MAARPKKPKPRSGSTIPHSERIKRGYVAVQFSLRNATSEAIGRLAEDNGVTRSDVVETAIEELQNRADSVHFEKRERK